MNDRFAPKVAAHLGIYWTSPDADRHKATTVDVASDKHVLWFAIESAHGKRTKQRLGEFA